MKTAKQQWTIRIGGRRRTLNPVIKEVFEWIGLCLIGIYVWLGLWILCL